MRSMNMDFENRIYVYSLYNVPNKRNLENKIDKFLYAYTFLSGFVFIEPSPADLVFVVLLVIYLTKIPIDKRILTMSMLLFVPCFLSAYLGQTLFYLINLKFFLTDLYLFLVFVVVASYFKSIKNFDKVLNKLMIFWALAATINIVVGIISLIEGGKLLGIHILVYGIRLKGFFKDPNVLGPFLVPPAVFFLNKAIEKNIFSFFTFFLMSFGVVFTFSRAAWLNYVTSIALMILIKFFKSKNTKRLLLFLLVLFILAMLFWKISSSVEVLGINLQSFFINRTGLKSYDEERFNAQRKFLDILSSTSILFGTGPGNYEAFAGMSTHSLYVRYIGERGLFGFLLLCIFLSITIIKSAKSKFSEILFSVILGQLFNSLFIDSLHWRHLWILISLVFVNKYKDSKILNSI